MLKYALVYYFNPAPKIWDDKICEHDRPYFLWIRCSFWQLKTSDPCSLTSSQATVIQFFSQATVIQRGWILLMTTKFWKPIGSSKLIRHPKWEFFAPVNSTGRGVPPPPSTSRLQLLCQGFPSMQCENRTDNVAINWLMRPARADTL